MLSRIWFPLVVALFLLLALPGVCLLMLHLFGVAGPINVWLEQNLQLTYQPLAPWTEASWPLAIILLLAIPALILLYFLKLKRRSMHVPSTFLWKKSIEDLHVNSLFQWLRKNLLLFLQLLVIVVLLYAVMGFRVHGGRSEGKHYILLLDNSASMSARDEAGVSRLEWAKQQARNEIAAAGDDDVGMVLVFNSKATTLQTYTNNRAKLRDAVDRIEQSNRVTRFEEALNLASSLANPVRSTEDAAVRPEEDLPGQERTYVHPRAVAATVHVYSDGRFPQLSEAVLENLAGRRAGNTSPLANMSLKYHRAGLAGASNTGIIEMNVVRWIGELTRTTEPTQRLEVSLRVRNYGPTTADVKLRLDVMVDGKLVTPEQANWQLEPQPKIQQARETQKLEHDPEVRRFILPPVDLRTPTVLHAYLADNKDALAVDDEAWLVVGMARKANVLIAGDSNKVLDAFFDQDATRELVNVKRLSPTDLKSDAYRQAARAGEFDLVIFDRCRPESEDDLPQANTFFIGTPPPPWKVSDKKVRNPYLVVGKVDHPLMRHLTTIWNVGVFEAFSLAPLVDKAEKKEDATITALIEGGGSAPMIFTLARGSFTDLVQAFPLVDDTGNLNTNWPLQPSFPLFMRNLLYVLGNVNDAIRKPSVQAGDPIVLRPDVGAQLLTLTLPTGNVQKLPRGGRADVVFGDTERPGTYKVQADNGWRSAFAVNLLDANESNIEPKDALEFGNDRIEAGQARNQSHDIWKWVVLGALGFLLLEWYIYNRRVHL